MKTKKRKIKIIKEERKMNEKRIANEVICFFNLQNKIKKYNDQFNLSKKNFYASMLEKGVEDETIIDTSGIEDIAIKVKKVQRNKIKWNEKKLLKKLKFNKKIINEVFSKTYTIIDMKGLISYLKECDVDPEIFKSFLDINIKVNEDVINNLYDLGKINLEDISDCYEVIEGEPYYTVRAIKNGK